MVSLFLTYTFTTPTKHTVLQLVYPFPPSRIIFTDSSKSHFSIPFFLNLASQKFFLIFCSNPVSSTLLYRITIMSMRFYPVLWSLLISFMLTHLLFTTFRANTWLHTHPRSTRFENTYICVEKQKLRKQFCYQNSGRKGNIQIDGHRNYKVVNSHPTHISSYDCALIKAGIRYCRQWLISRQGGIYRFHCYNYSFGVCWRWSYLLIICKYDERSKSRINFMGVDRLTCPGHYSYTSCVSIYTL